MSGLLGGGSQATAPVAVTGIQIQTSVYGQCITVLYGQTRTSANLLWYDGFTATPIYQKSGKGGGCFRAGTWVATPTGSAPIDNIAVGEPIFCLNPATNKVEIGVVSQTWKHEDAPNDLLHFVLLDNDINNKDLIDLFVTDNHHIWIDDGEYQEAGQLVVGDELRLLEGGLATLVEIINLGKEQFVYNLTVEPHHNYFAEGILVHNGGGGKQASGYNYFADVIFGICEGPVSDIIGIWSNQDPETTPATYALSIIKGDYGQPPLAFVTANFPAAALPYSGITYAAATPFSMGSSASLPNLGFLVNGVHYGSAANGIDADASFVITDILTNANYGAGLPTRCIGQPTFTSETVAIATTIIVAHAGIFITNLSVNNGTTLMTCVPTTTAPAPGQYSFVGGTYTFNATDTGAITIAYSYRAPLLNYQAFTLISGFGISPAYDSQTTASTVVGDIATFTFSEFVWSSGCLNIVPRSVQPLADGIHTYTPNAVVFDLTLDDFMPSQSSSNNAPVTMNVIRQADQINTIQVEFLDRSNQFATSIAEQSDASLIDIDGRRFSGSQTAHMFCDVNAANYSAQLLLQKQYILRTFSFDLDERFILLDPMDLVSLTEPGMGLDHEVVRITEMTENSDGTISFTAEEVLEAMGTTAQYSFNIGQGYIPNTNADPGDINLPMILNAPTALTNGQLQIWAALSGSGKFWGGADIWLSNDDTTFSLIGRQIGPSRMGYSTTSFASGSDPDTTNTLNVDLTESAGQLTSGTTSDADLGNTLAMLGDELIAYETATLTGPHEYAISDYIRRGLYSTTIADHPAESPFARLDSQIFKQAYNSNQIGQTIYLKFTSINLWGQGEQSLADVDSFPFTIGSTFVVLDQASGPQWLAGTSSGFVRHHTNVLVPDSTLGADTMTDSQLWDTFVASPVASPTFTLPTIDVGAKLPMNVHLSFTATPGPGVVGSPSTSTSLDTWTGSDPAIYTPWSTGSRDAEFFSGRLTANTSVPALISDFQIHVFN